MRRNSNVVAGSLVVVAALLAGCGVTTQAPPPRASDQPLPTPSTTVSVTTAPPTTPPVTSPAAPVVPPPVPLSREAPEGPRAETPPPAPPPTTEPAVPANQRGRFVVLNFDNADIETVVHAASEIVGFNYVLAPDVRGKVTVQTSGRIPQEDVFGVLLAILEVQGFTAVKSGNLYKIVRIEGARERAVPTIIGATPDPARTTDEIVTQIVPMRYASVNDISTLLRPLISTRGNLIAHRDTNVIILTDTASNIRRLLDIVRQVDVQVALEELQIIPLRYADAQATAQVLTQLFQRGVRVPGAPGVPGIFTPTPAPTVPVPGQPGAVPVPGAPAGQTPTAERPPLIVAETRSNSLIVNARRNDLEMIRRLVNQLDINVGGGRRVFIYFAENAKAKDLAATLNAIYGARETVPATTPTQLPRTPGSPQQPPVPSPTAAPGLPVGLGPLGGTGVVPGDLSFIEGQVRFIADETTNAVIVTTLPRVYPEIEATIKQLDKMPRQVLIEVLVAEITLNDDTKLGLDWAIRSGRFVIASNSNSGIPTTIATGSGDSSASITAPSPKIPIPGALGALGPLAAGLTAFTFETDRFFAILNAFASENRVNVVSNPHIMTSENKKAVINVSTSVPIVTSQQVPLTGTTTGVTATTPTAVGTQSVEYRDAGVILTVTPRIGERGTVALDIKQEVNDILSLSTGTLNSPQFSKREAETSVVLLNNQTLVLGGLIKDQATMNDRGVPLLKNIPVVGFLFGFKERIISRTELLLLITPRVVGTPVDAARVTDRMRHMTPELDETIKKAPGAPRRVPPPPPAGVVPPPPPPPAVEPVPPSR